MSDPKQYIHRSLASGRWQTMTLAEQLGNVGSEYERALRGKEKGDAKYFEGALARLLELLDLTIADSRWTDHRLKKLHRLREVICDEFCNEVRAHPDRRDLRKYFLSVGLMANEQRYAARNRAIDNR
jgi:hypothetical protein